MAGDEFPGFPKEAVKFLSDLKANNTRDWFTANKATYEAAIKRPAAEFCDAMSARLEKMTGTRCKPKVFRINRDLRFSKDKTPYNAHLHISFIPETGQPSPPCWFFGLEPKRIVFGAGNFGFDKQALETYREKVDGPDGKKLAKLLERLEAKDARTGEPELKRVPSGYAQDHPLADLLRRKGLSAWIDMKDTKAASCPEFTSECQATFKTLKPLYDWLID